MIKTEFTDVLPRENEVSASDRVKFAAFVTSEIFVLSIIAIILVRGDEDTFFLDFGSAVEALFLACLPILTDIIIKRKMTLPIFLFCQIYTLGNMSGEFFKLYYTTSWWDKLLHFCGGAVFAFVGVVIARLLSKKRSLGVWLCAVFALCFSMAVAAGWEFFEFGVDCIWGKDMQHDTIITSISSHELSEFYGGVGGFEEITEVTVNGVAFPFEGYLDIGLYDTMYDMMFETLGAFVFSALYVITRGKIFDGKNKCRKQKTGDLPQTL